MPSKTNLLLLGSALLVGVIALGACAFFGPETGLAVLGASALGAGFLMKDANLKVTKALPNGAATTNSDGIDLGVGTRSDFQANCEVLISAPALTTTELGDTQTITYTLQHDTDSAFGTVADLYPDLIVQTGAGGAGAAAATKRVRLPTTVSRYIRLKQVKAGASNASTSVGTLEVLF